MLNAFDLTFTLTIEICSLTISYETMQELRFSDVFLNFDAILAPSAYNLLEVIIMKHHLSEILYKIGDQYRDQILDGARNYLEVNIGKEAEKLGYTDVKQQYAMVNVIVPLKKPINGMKVRIDGRTFVNYARFDSGLVAPGSVAEDAGLSYTAFIPNDSMILNFN